jgi:hypothetical protein
MKPMNAVYAAAFYWAVLIITGCGKNDTISVTSPVDYHNIDLKKQSVATVKAAVKGRWKSVKDSIFGWAGWDVLYPQHDRFANFLSNDTLKIESNTTVTFYEKGNYVWEAYPRGGDSAFTFKVDGKINWVLDKIYNDTLKIDAWPDIMFLKKEN